MIEQSEWRTGLPAPDYERIPNNVHNIIIHHSAGSNTDTNYIQVVRNIYIFHTQVRGWSDIGYNYLISQDGTVFKGRDPGTLAQDEVLGAHFCSSNTGTLGICVLGNYEEVPVPEAAFSSLTEMLTWKLGEDSLNPSGYYPHPLNPFLFVIAGHRDGCATECPGNMLYARLADIRNVVFEEFNSCGFVIKPVLSIPEISGNLKVYLAHGEIIVEVSDGEVSEVILVDLYGRNYYPEIRKDGGKFYLSGAGLKKGVYIIVVRGRKISFTEKIII